MLKNRLEKLLHSPATTFFLAIIAPCLFVWGTNWHMYTLEELGTNFVFILIAACFVYIVVHCICKIKLPAWMQKIRNFLFLIVIFTIIFFLLSNTINAIMPQNQTYRIATKLMLVTVLSVIALSLRFKIVNVFLTVLSLLFFMSILAKYDYHHDVELKSYSYILQRTPNIYCFKLEAYHDLATMRQIYSIDTSNFETFLEKNDFVIYEDALSNSPATLLSLGDLFSMQLDSGQMAGTLDAKRRTRQIIGGSSDNMVLKNLKEHNYYTKYVLYGSPYYMFSKGQYLDDVDYSTYFPLRPLCNLNEKLQSLFMPNLIHTKENELTENKEIAQIIIQHIDEKVVIKKPLFLFALGGALHAALSESRERWIAGGRYQRAVQTSNRELQHIVEHIAKYDPASVIILFGDHGALRFHDLQNCESFEELDAKLRVNGESLESFVEDAFGIFMAVRMPGGRKNIAHGFHMSPVNLFRHVFAALNEDPAMLHDRAPSESKFRGVTLARDGKVMGSTAR